jgi:hypothetical protein
MDKRELDSFIGQQVSVTLNDGTTYKGQLGRFALQGTPMYNINHRDLFCAFRVVNVNPVDKAPKKR